MNWVPTSECIISGSHNDKAILHPLPNPTKQKRVIGNFEKPTPGHLLSFILVRHAADGI